MTLEAYKDAHEAARELITLAPAGLSDVQQTWLGAHLDECAVCRNYREAAGRAVAALRSVPIVADARLVRATQMRVRFHAGRLREARERMWLVGIACLAVGLSATLTVPLLWKLCAWLGEQAEVPAVIWQAGFVFFYIAPALVVSVLLLARGSQLGNTERRQQGQ